MTLARRPFGRTGWDVGEVSFGAWQIGGQWGPVDDRESVGALHEAYASGVDFVDTAEMYGSGHSEEVVGRSLREWSGSRIRVATKVQPVRWPHPSDPDPDIGEAYPADYLREQAAASRRRLGLDRIDLFQLHCWMPSGLVDRAWLATLQDLQRDGTIDRIGVSLRDYRPDEGVELARTGLVDSIQVVYNIFEQEPERELLPAAAQSRTAIIARVALDSGSLGGTWTEDTYAGWPEGSVLHTLFRGERFAETLRHVERVRAVAATRYERLDEAAIRFVLDSPEVSTVIIGMSAADAIERNVAFGDGRGLAPGLRAALKGEQWRRNYYV